ncbi:MAG: hypothetical protein [Caudoviricetes sp.]|nr:MAG: hypothetical protein [Caudoviricetes sp.]
MRNFNEIKVKLKLSIGYPFAEREDDVLLSDVISENDWNKLNLFEKDDFLKNEILDEWANHYIEISAELDN